MGQSKHTKYESNIAPRNWWDYAVMANRENLPSALSGSSEFLNQENDTINETYEYEWAH